MTLIAGTGIAVEIPDQDQAITASPASRSFYYYILAAGIVIDLFWVLVVNTQPYSDFEYYNNLAIQISQGGQWGDTYTSVGYAIVLGIVYRLFGVSLVVAKAFNIALTALNGLLLIGILAKLQLPEKGKKAFFIIMVFLPTTIYYNSLTGSEIIFTTLLLTASRLYLGDSSRRYLWIGALVGLGAMIKPFYLAFFLVVLVSDYLGFGLSFKASLRNCLLVLAVSLVVIAPWIIRNSVMMGQPTYVSNNGGIVLYINNNSNNKDGKWMPAEEIEDSLVLTPEYINANYTERNNMLTDEALRWIVSHPGRFLQLADLRLLQTYIYGGDIDYSLNGSDISKENSWRLSLLFKTIRLPIYIIGYLTMLSYFVAALFRIFRKGRREGASIYLFAVFMLFVAIYSVTEGQARYAFPTIFITVYFCVYGVAAFVNIFSEESPGERSKAAAGGD